MERGHPPHACWRQDLSIFLSGLFCCLCFSDVLFAVWAGGGGPPEQNKNKQRQDLNLSKKHNPFQTAGGVFFSLLFGRVFFTVWAGVRIYFLLSGRAWERACFFCCLGGCVCVCVFFCFAVLRGACVILFLFGRGRVFFCCLGGVFFLLFGRGSVCNFVSVWARACFFFFAVWGGGWEFTHLPVCLARL